MRHRFLLSTIRVLLCIFPFASSLCVEVFALDEEKDDGVVPVVASVNGALITKFDVDWEMGYVKQMVRGTAEERKEQVAEARRFKTRELVLTEILIQAAKRHGIKITDRMVQQKMLAEKKHAGGWGSYFRLLAERGLTYAENWKRLERGLYVRDFERRLVTPRSRTKFVYLFRSEITVTPKEVRDYYRRRPEEFREEEAGIFRILWLKYDDFATRKDAREKAEALRERILEKAETGARGELFGDLARKFSRWETAKDGGRMVLEKEQALAPELNNVLERLEPGELSTPVNTDVGVFLLFLEKPRQKVLKPFDEVQMEIQMRLRTRKWRDHVKEEQERLLRRAHIWPEEIARLIEKALGP